MLCNNHNNRLSTENWLGYFARAAVLGVLAVVLLSFLCRPTFAGVSISPEVIVLSGDQTIRVTAHLNTRLPVVVDLVELPEPSQGMRQPNQSYMLGGKTVARLTRQADGSFAATVSLSQQQPATRFFQVAARFAFLPFSRMNATDLRVAVTDGRVILPPDLRGADKTTFEHVGSDHNGVTEYLPTSTTYSYYDGQHIDLSLDTTHPSIYTTEHFTLVRYTSKTLAITFLYPSLREGSGRLITKVGEGAEEFNGSKVMAVGVAGEPNPFWITFVKSSITDPEEFVRFQYGQHWDVSGKTITFKTHPGYFLDITDLGRPLFIFDNDGYYIIRKDALDDTIYYPLILDTLEFTR